LRNVGEKWRIYEGELKFDLKEGNGCITFTNGEIYKGQFKEDRISGLGTFYS
jgi:hypothetical protein